MYMRNTRQFPWDSSPRPAQCSANSHFLQHVSPQLWHNCHPKLPFLSYFLLRREQGIQNTIYNQQNETSLGNIHVFDSSVACSVIWSPHSDLNPVLFSHLFTPVPLWALPPQLCTAVLQGGHCNILNTEILLAVFWIQCTDCFEQPLKCMILNTKNTQYKSQDYKTT